MRTIRELPVLFLVALVIAFLVKTFVAQAFYIPSGSMLPQLQLYDRVVVSKVAYKLHEPRRGDIVVFDEPIRDFVPEPDHGNAVAKAVNWVLERVGIVPPSTDEFIKRVIALPGESVEGRDGKIFIDGRELREPYLDATVRTGAFGPVTVEDGELWVMGDNRGNSQDSRVFGAIDQDTVVGRAIVRVWPLADASFL
ncbi:MAG: signal peptidase I [Actinobacteria bacterium]|nr:signal peptidase I [Actinomycetota bacterium]